MWPPWGGASPTVHARPSFRCTSFKDIQILCSSDDSADFATSQQESRELHRHRLPPPSTKKIFHRVRAASSLLRAWTARPERLSFHSRSISLPVKSEQIWLPGTEDRVVVYLTSLRVVRRTFDACRSVISVLGGFRVAVDERDVAMCAGFLAELQQILGIPKEKLTLPRVFVGGKYIGGAEEVRQMYETGELKKLVAALPAAGPGVCKTCGGYRFVVCGDCDGSHKVYSDKGGFRSCTACTESGLIKCPSCYPTAVAA